MGTSSAESRPGKRRSSSALPLSARKPRLDLLEQPPVAIRIAERGIGLVRAALRVWSRNTSPSEVEHLADLDAAADEIRTRSVDVGDDQQQALDGAGLICGEARPESDRAR